MVLVLGHPDDCLTLSVCKRLKARGALTRTVSEDALFSEVPFTFEQRGATTCGSMRLEGEDIRLSEFSSVLVRLPRFWWPSEELDLQDQMFVYHENGAAWFALLASLSGAVINRFDLAWWLNDITYPGALVRDLGRRLEVRTTPSTVEETLPARIIPRAPEASSSSVYVVGGAVIARAPEDRRTRDWLNERMPALSRWQSENGAELCRLDFDDDHRLQHVELFPLLEEETAEVVEHISAATVEMMT